MLHINNNHIIGPHSAFLLEYWANRPESGIQFSDDFPKGRIRKVRYRVVYAENNFYSQQTRWYPVL
jgi:hypothetical protein